MIKRVVNSSRSWYVRRVTVQTVAVAIVQGLTLMVMTYFDPDIYVSGFLAAIFAIIAYGLSQTVAWFIFIRVFARFHPFFYPVISLALSGLLVVLTSAILPGFEVANFWSGFWLVVVLTISSTVAGVIFGYDDDSWFDFNVVRPLLKQQKAQHTSDEPGHVFMEIDGLSFDILNKALEKGYMPTLESWIKNGSYKLVRWETDFSSQTAAMQAGILHGNNSEIIAYRWYDRKQKKIINSANPFMAAANEAILSNKKGLLSVGGASRGNMFSGDADEALFTYSTLFDKKRGRSPGFYLFLLSPYVLTRTVTKFMIDVITEIYDGARQSILDIKPRVNRGFPYHLYRGFLNSLMPELVTYTAIIDVLRGVPAMYLLYPGYDDLGHFSGIDRLDSLRSLSHTDSQLARIDSAVKKAPRPYYITILSDHGQSQGTPFRQKYGKSIDVVVNELVKEKMEVYADLDSHEALDVTNAMLTDAANQNTKSTRLIRKALRKKTQDGYVDVGQDKKAKVLDIEKGLVVLSSGSLAMIYSANSNKRLMMEEIDKKLPGFIAGLVKHPGIGYVLVDSSKHGAIVLGKKGKYYLRNDKIEGENPLAPYGENAAMHIKKANTYTTMPDVLFNATFNPKTGEIGSFEEQVGHHGGLGGMQNRPFLCHRNELEVPENIIGAPSLYKVLYGWRRKGLSAKKRKG